MKGKLRDVNNSTCGRNPREGDKREAVFKEITAKHFPELMKDMHPQTENAYNGLK